jgi:hypothetical protein
MTYKYRRLALERVYGRGVMTVDKRVKSGKSFGYLGCGDITTKELFDAEKERALNWMKNNPDILSISYGEGHLWVGTMERKGNTIVWTERLDF